MKYIWYIQRDSKQTDIIHYHIMTMMLKWWLKTIDNIFQMNPENKIDFASNISLLKNALTYKLLIKILNQETIMKSTTTTKINTFKQHSNSGSTNVRIIRNKIWNIIFV